jgi:hypothetical protein
MSLIRMVSSSAPAIIEIVTVSPIGTPEMTNPEIIPSKPTKLMELSNNQCRR